MDIGSKSTIPMPENRLVSSEFESSICSSDTPDYFEGKKLGLSGVLEDFSGKNKLAPINRAKELLVAKQIASDSKIPVTKLHNPVDLRFLSPATGSERKKTSKKVPQKSKSQIKKAFSSILSNSSTQDKYLKSTIIPELKNDDEEDGDPEDFLSELTRRKTFGGEYLKDSQASRDQDGI